MPRLILIKIVYLAEFGAHYFPGSGRQKAKIKLPADLNFIDPHRASLAFITALPCGEVDIIICLGKIDIFLERERKIIRSF